MTQARWPRSQGSGRTITAMRRMIGGVRQVHQEVALASEAIFRSVGASRPQPDARADGPSARAGPPAHVAAAAERTSQPA